MSGTTGPPTPDRRPDGDPAPVPPAPPPPTGWTTPTPHGQGWDDPADDWRSPGSSRPLSGLPGASHQHGDAWSSSSTNTDWQVPDTKPGVIPLRPLGVGEILDGAVTTIRRNLGAMLGLSAVVAAVTQLITTGSLAWVFGDDITQPDLGLSDDPDEFADMGVALPAAAATAFVTLIGTVFLTGVLTVVVGQAVLGRGLTIEQAWREAKGRLPRLLGLTLLYILVWLSPFLIALALALLVTLVWPTGGALVAVLGTLAAIPLGIWLYVRHALSLPSLMLESSVGPDGRTRPVKVVEALRRSAVLVRGSWWRVFGILLLIIFITWLIAQVIAVPFGVPTLVGGNDFGGNVTTWFIVNTLAGIIATTITSPFSAAATALLYVDRRIRREGLDIELARASGVRLPGRDQP